MTDKFTETVGRLYDSLYPAFSNADGTLDTAIYNTKEEYVAAMLVAIEKLHFGGSAREYLIQTCRTENTE